MDDDEPYTRCPFCRNKVDPNAEGVTYAVEQNEAVVMDGRLKVDGMGGFFHPGCPPGPVGYSPRPLPGADLTTP